MYNFMGRDNEIGWFYVDLVTWDAYPSSKLLWRK
jgi:hypothetical protein